ncbi:ergothioneine biosynthesis protein EgtC, partial [Streptomyces boncukensis]
MCRHLARLGPDQSLTALLLDPPHGLYRQSWAPRRQRHGTVNADGFGLGWYPPGDGAEPARYRRATPIWADPNLPDLARSLRSGAVLAAVRDATPGTSQDEAACAPYRAGRWLFSHNGAIAGWEDLPGELPAEQGAARDPARLLRLEARCDSALLWSLVHARLAAGEPPGAALESVVRAVAAVRPEARLNLLLTDGRTLAATRWGDTLAYRAAGSEAVVASEPLDDGSAWQDVPEGSLLLATRDTGVETVPLSPATPPA